MRQYLPGESGLISFDLSPPLQIQAEHRKDHSGQSGDVPNHSFRSGKTPVHQF
jgi:hypothetical protein